jgi:L-asparaginase II
VTERRDLGVDVTVWRGSIAESRHRVEAAVADPSGRLTAATPGCDVVTAFRSSAKPFQLLPFVERGLASRWNLGDEHLAVMAASHSGSRRHVAVVRELLERFGLEERMLACGTHEPLDPDALAEVRRDPSSATPLHNNCSGKHAGMLALCKAEGWPLEGYERAEHPLQQLLLRTVGEVCDVDPASIQTGVDGCSVVVFGLPLAAMATGFARLAAARPDGSPREQALARIRDAMAAQPYLVGGHQRFDTELMEAGRGALVAKIGAEGLECVALRDARLGVAVKCEDGSARGAGPATLALLEHLGLVGPDVLAAMAAQRRPVVRNVRGLEVGRVEAAVRSGVPAA